MELVDVRDLALHHLQFEDAPQMLNRVYVWRHSWPVHHLYPQRLGGVFGVVIMLEYCPAAQSLKGGDHALLQYVTVHVGIHGLLPKHNLWI